MSAFTLLSATTLLGLATTAGATGGHDLLRSGERECLAKNDDVEIHSVSEALGLGDDNWVVLEGAIESRLGDDEYLFRDETGVIEVEIDDDIWVGPAGTDMRIHGEVDRDRRSLEIDVKRVELF